MRRSIIVLVSLMFLLVLGNSAFAQVQVGIVLPTKDEPRWIQDQTRFMDALKTAGVSAEVLFSQGDPAKEKSNVEALVSKGIKVLIICPQDGTAAAAAADEANKAGVKVISYDRLIRDTASVNYYVTFDSVQVGMAWGDYLVKNAKGKGNNLYLYAGAASDNNAFLFFEGAWKVLQPKIADGTFVVRNSSKAAALAKKAVLTRDEQSSIIGQVTTNWNFADAKSKAEANLTVAKASEKGTVYIAAPNDGTARAHRRRLRRRQSRKEILHHRPGCRNRVHPVHHRWQAVHDGPQGRAHSRPGRPSPPPSPISRAACLRKPRPTTTEKSMFPPSRPSSPR